MSQKWKEGWWGCSDILEVYTLFTGTKWIQVPIFITRTSTIQYTSSTFKEKLNLK